MENTPAIQQMARRCVLASELAYENEEQIRAVVTDQWKMEFKGFFDCWNEYLQSNTTQAFVFTDTAQPPAMVFVAFRGTQISSWGDLATDFDFSYYSLPGLGRVHTGFLEALGLGTRKDRSTLNQARDNMANNRRQRSDGVPDDRLGPISGLPNDDRPSNENPHVLAYDAISRTIRRILNANEMAKLYVTGHSLGGALATLFTAVRLHENNGDDARLGAVFTFGQPRVGNSQFAHYMEDTLRPRNRQAHERKYFRAVFEADIVPRLPCWFSHIWPCYLYRSRYQHEVLNCEIQTSCISILNELYQFLAASICSGRQFEPRCLTLLVPRIRDHSIVNYVNAIQTTPDLFLAEVNI